MTDSSLLPSIVCVWNSHQQEWSLILLRWNHIKERSKVRIRDVTIEDETTIPRHSGELYLTCQQHPKNVEPVWLIASRCLGHDLQISITRRKRQRDCRNVGINYRDHTHVARYISKLDRQALPQHVWWARWIPVLMQPGVHVHIGVQKNRWIDPASRTERDVDWFRLFPGPLFHLPIHQIDDVTSTLLVDIPAQSAHKRLNIRRFDLQSEREQVRFGLLKCADQPGSISPSAVR